jgi:small-conductance mechanosensitive channel
VLRFSCWIALLSLGFAAPLVAESSGRQEAASVEPARDTLPATAEEPRDIQCLREALAEDIRQLERELAEDNNAGESSTQTTLLSLLGYLDSTYAQQQIVAERAKEVQAEYAQLRQQTRRRELLGSQAMQSYSFVELERLRDSRDDAADQRRLVEHELAATTSQLDSIRDQFGTHQRHRRQLHEAIERTKDPAQRVGLQHELRLTEVRARTAEELLALRSQEFQLKQLESKLLEYKQTTCDEWILAAAAVVPFRERDLDELLAPLDNEQVRLNQEILQQQQTLHNFEQQIALDRGMDDAASAERIRSIRRSLHRGIADSNDSLSMLLAMRKVWTDRFRIVNGLANDQEMHHLLGEATKFLDRIRAAQAVLSTRTQETRLDADVANRIQSGDPVDPIRDLQAKVISEAFRQSGRRQRLLRQAERLYLRVHADLTRKLGTEPDPLTIAQLKPLVQSLWRYELLAVEDRPITVGKLCLGLVILVSGVGLSRTFSRAVGRRMLPGLGFHHGASLAAQTMTFYSLVVVIGFFTLEFLNIPITVLTFMGGAAAIAVGFGSQTILNNFVSGLIILGEQPIRVGDLIELDGLHGSVEHIGGRSTQVRTGTNVTIFIPNSKLIENSVRNLTRSSNEIRTTVRVAVAHSSDVELVMRLVARAVDENPLVQKRPEPVVLFHDLGQTSLAFEVHFWVLLRSLLDVERAESLVRRNIHRLFAEHQIALSAPPRDLSVALRSPVDIRLTENVPDEIPSIVPKAA